MTYDEALKYAIGLMICSGLQSISSNQFFMMGSHNGMKVRIAVCSLIYRKVRNDIPKTKKCCAILNWKYFSLPLVTVVAIITNSIGWNSTGQSSKSIIEWCESLWMGFVVNERDVDCSAALNHSCVFTVARNRCSRFDWHFDYIHYCAYSK